MPLYCTVAIAKKKLSSILLPESEAWNFKHNKSGGQKVLDFDSEGPAVNTNVTEKANRNKPGKTPISSNSLGKRLQYGLLQYQPISFVNSLILRFADCFTQKFATCL